MADSNGRQTNTLDYRYYNAVPGTVAVGSSAVSQATETTHQTLNPATLWTQPDPGDTNPEVAGPRGAEDLDNPAANENLGDTEGGSNVGDSTAQPPNKPTSVAAVAGAAGHATVTWVAPVDTDRYAITGYSITGTSSDGGAAKTQTVAGTLLTVDMSGLTSAKHYTFVVTASNNSGPGAASSASNSVTVA